MAFEGYKKEAWEVNEEFLEMLLKATIANASINPVILYDTKTNHGSPWHEISDGLRKLFKIDLKGNIDTTLPKP
jgi:hypothetical protein